MAVALLLVPVQGCYVLHLAGGQLGLVNDQVPIEEAIAREADPMRRALLAEVPGIRAFGESVVGLKRSDSYVGYYAISRPWLTLVLSAAPRDKLVPYTRWYPIAGRVPYRSFFDEARAKEAQRELDDAGYDTYLHHSPAYSTLGFFRDPVTTPMLDRGPSCPPPASSDNAGVPGRSAATPASSDNAGVPGRSAATPSGPERLDGCRLAGLAETLLHELTHQHMYLPGQTTFNEQLASFVGRTAMVQYLSSRGVYDDELRARLLVAFGRSRALETEAAKVTAELDALYESPISLDEKLARREPLFRKLAERAAQIYPDTVAENWHFNNARLLQYRRYNRAADTMRKTYEEAGGSWSRFWQLVAR